MRMIMIGCEYAGKTKLAVEVSKWMMREMGRPFVRWHNHFVVPHLDRHMVVASSEDSRCLAPGKSVAEEFGEEDLCQVLKLRPMLLEQLTRHMVWRHMHPDMYRTERDYLLINTYYADAVYAPLYYGYGSPGTFADRRRRAREWDRELVRLAPDTVLVHVKASPDAIRRRMHESPCQRYIPNERDVEVVLERFEEEYDRSLVYRRFTIDTTSASVEECLGEFLTRVRRYLTPEDFRPAK